MRIEQTVPIGRIPEDVFRHVVDVERYPDWQVAAGIKRVTLAEPAPLRAGSHFRVERVTQGMAGTIDCVVTVLEPGVRFAFEGQDSAGFLVLVDTLLVPDGPATRLDWTMEITNHGINRFLQPIVAGQVRRAAAADFDTFKRRLEAIADEPVPEDR